MNTFIITLLVIYTIMFLASSKRLPKWFCVVGALIFLSTVVILNICVWQDQQNTVLRIWLLVNTGMLWRVYGNLERVIEETVSEDKLLVKGIVKLIVMAPCLVQLVLCCKIML